MQVTRLNIRKLQLSAAVAAAAMISFVPPVAFGQTSTQSSNGGRSQSTTNQEPKQLQAVQVTGSHIRQIDLQTEQPIATITQEEIKQTGMTTVGDILHQMTSVGFSGLGTQSTQSPDVIEQGGSFVDFRYLGSQRVLVLVNGKRWVTDNDGMTDLSTIPASVIERIEILKDGSSAIYGSDAISGVVNIITRKNFDGAQLDVHTGTTDKGDGTQQELSLTFGTSNDKASLMMNVSYNKVGAIWDRTRELTSEGDGIYHPYIANYHATPQGRFTDSTGTYILKNLGDDTSNIGNFRKIDPGHLDPGDTYNQFYSNNQFRMPTELKSLYVQGSYKLTDHINFDATAVYSQRTVNTTIGPSVLTGGAFRNLSGKISKDSIYNPTDEDIEFSVLFPNHPRDTTHVNNTAHISAGFNGDFTFAGDHYWNWDVGVGYSKTSGHTRTNGQVDTRFLQNGIGPSYIDATGVPTCGTPGNPFGIPTQDVCIPIDILNGPAGMASEIESRLFIDPQFVYAFSNRDISGNITGNLFKIPTGGDVAFAFGLQRQEVEGYNRPELYKQFGLTTSAANTATNGSYSVNSAYLELSVPLLQDLPGAKYLGFDLARRYSDYSNFGGTTDDKIGFQYRPIDDLLVRGTYGESFRAPTIEDIAGGITESYSSYTDPCDTVFGAGIYGDTLHQTCLSQLAASGFPNSASFRQENTTGGPISSPNSQSATIFKSGPSKDLGPETATTKTLGLVYSPSWVPGRLTASIDWFQVKLRNMITGVSANDVLRNCYQGVVKYCDSFSRNPLNGQVVNLFSGLINAGYESVEGYDFGLTYRLPETAIGQFALRSELSYYTKLEQRTTPDAPLQEMIGWSGSWRIRDTTSLSWSKGPWSAIWRVRYFSSMREPCSWGTETECNMPDFIDPFHGKYPANRIGAVSYHDLSVGYKVPWHGIVRLGVNNLFDRAPPITYTRPAGQPPVYPSYDIDRFWFVDYQQNF